jgi:hypothetical protein
MNNEATEKSEFYLEPNSMNFSNGEMSEEINLIQDNVNQSLNENELSESNSLIGNNDSGKQINMDESFGKQINFNNSANESNDMFSSPNLLFDSESFILPKYVNYLKEPTIEENFPKEKETETDLETKKKPTSKDVKIVKVENPNTFLEKKRGRISKSDKAKGKNGIHTNNKYDNITTKIKIMFTNSCLEFINYLLEKYKKKLLLKKMSSKSSKNIKVDKMLDWFDETLKSYLSSDISSKFRNFDKNFNQMTILKIYNDDELQEVTKVLNHTIREMYDKYINNEVIEGFKTLKDTLEVLKEEGQEEKYIQKYENIALDLLKIIKNKKPRKSKKYKKSKEL